MLHENYNNDCTYQQWQKYIMVFLYGKLCMLKIKVRSREKQQQKKKSIMGKNYVWRKNFIFLFHKYTHTHTHKIHLNIHIHTHKIRKKGRNEGKCSILLFYNDYNFTTSCF